MSEIRNKAEFLANIGRILTQMQRSKTWLNKLIFGVNSDGRPINNLWRKDQQTISFERAVKTAKILNTSVENLLNAAHSAAYNQTPEEIGVPKSHGRDSRPHLYSIPELDQFQVTAVIDRPNDDYINDVRETLESGEKGVIYALKANIVQFKEMVRDRKRIKELESEVEQLTRQLKAEKT